MRREARLILAAASLVLAAGCERISAERVAPEPATAVAAAPIQNLNPFIGLDFSQFVARNRDYEPEALGLSAADRSRLWRAMAIPTVGTMIDGGGAQALVFRGCAETGCGDGLAVVAVDAATGMAFVAVRDAGGGVVMSSNDRVEALLRLNSPTRDWADPALPQTAAVETAQP